MSPFESLNYRQSLSALSRAFKQGRPGWTLQRLAEGAGIQPPYLTNVFKERAHLNLDQIFALTKLMNLPEDESEYLQLLLDWERCGNSERKALLKARIDSLRKEKLKSKANLKKEIVAGEAAEVTRFFLNPYYQLISVFVGVGRFAKDPLQIAACLSLGRAQLQAWMNDLLEMGFVARKTGGGYEKLKRNFHLPKESPLCEPHQMLLRQCAAQHLQSLPESEKYNFAVTFTADEATREKIQREFLKFLKTIEADVKAAPSNEVYGMSFDLFTWSSAKND